ARILISRYDVARARCGPTKCVLARGAGLNTNRIFDCHLTGDVGAYQVALNHVRGRERFQFHANRVARDNVTHTWGGPADDVVEAVRDQNAEAVPHRPGPTQISANEAALYTVTRASIYEHATVFRRKKPVDDQLSNNTVVRSDHKAADHKRAGAGDSASIQFDRAGTIARRIARIDLATIYGHCLNDIGQWRRDGNRMRRMRRGARNPEPDQAGGPRHARHLRALGVTQ